MTDFTLTPDMAAERSAAIGIVRDHFNRLALESLHDDLALLAHGEATAIIKRDKRKQELLSKIEAARTLAEIELTLSDL